jgi:hypothetical protein
MKHDDFEIARKEKSKEVSPNDPGVAGTGNRNTEN